VDFFGHVIGAKSWVKCLLAFLSAGSVGLAFFRAGRAASGAFGIVTCDQRLVLGRTGNWLSCRDGAGGKLDSPVIICKYRAHVGVLLEWFRPTILSIPLQGFALHSLVQENSVVLTQHPTLLPVPVYLRICFSMYPALHAL